MKNDELQKKILQEKLEQVKQKIDKNIRHGDSYLNGTLDYVKLAKGKMLRPMLLLIGSTFAKSNKKFEESFIELAAVIETLHMATLVHDDIIDEAKLRRGIESIQSKYSKSYAVYMGDFLLSKSFLMIAKLDVDKEVGLALAKAVHHICVGEMKQHKWRYNTDISPLNYLRIVSGKTAVLFGVSLSAGAIHGKVSDETVKLLGRIGYQTGMAFQLMDDLLDYVGDEEKVGKELQTDLIRGYYSLPVIYALNSEIGPLIKEKLDQGNMSKNECQEIISLIKKSGGIERTRELAVRYNEKSLILINQLPKGKGKEMLRELLPEMLKRVH